jgi:hypothetical protein
MRIFACQFSSLCAINIGVVLYFLWRCGAIGLVIQGRQLLVGSGSSPTMGPIGGFDITPGRPTLMKFSKSEFDSVILATAY